MRKNSIKLIFSLCIFIYQFSLFADEKLTLENKINSYLSKMTIQEKVGQILMVEIGYITPEEVQEYNIGAILNGGGSFPYKKNNHVTQDWIDLADEYVFNGDLEKIIEVTYSYRETEGGFLINETLFEEYL